jgi:hypothetical protein
MHFFLKKLTNIIYYIILYNKLYISNCLRVNLFKITYLKKKIIIIKKKNNYNNKKTQKFKKRLKLHI